MKASLLLSLSLLLVPLAACASSDAEDDPKTTQSSMTTQSPNTTAEAPGTAQSPNTTAEASGTTQSSNTTAEAPGTTQSPNTTAEAPGTTQSPNTTAEAPGTTQSPNTTAEAPGTTQSPNTTAEAPGTTQSSNTTAEAPGTTQSPNTTAEAPGTSQPSNTTAEAPGTTQSSNTTAEAPGTTQSSNTTAEAPGTTQSPNTTAEAPGTTQSPNVSSQTTIPGPRDPCEINSCGEPASCVNLHSEYFCLCSEGYYYQTLTCVKGKTFPGELILKVPESSDLENKNSADYQDFHNYVLKFLKTTLEKPDFGYGQTIILKVSDFSLLSARSAMRAAEKTVYVSVVNMFEENTTQNENTIAAAIKKAVDENNNITGYTSQDLCELYGCVKNESNCQNGFQCTCKPGWARPNTLTPFCLPQECPEPCKAEDGKQCLMKDNGAPECVCMPGYQKATDGKCEECPFGYSGMDCKDQFQLILTIVGTIAGALILILLIVLIISASSKKKKKNVEEQNLIENDFHNVRLQQTGFSNSSFSNFGADNSIFPKVRTGTPRQTQNPYDNQRSMPRPDY